jgi:purine-cytosine permease-like protein
MHSLNFQKHTDKQLNTSAQALDLNGSNQFDWYYFGIATGISFSLIAQIGEQVDYLRFMPDKHKSNRVIWWLSLVAAGPGWIVLGCLKQLGGALLASLVVMTGLGSHISVPA